MSHTARISVCLALAGLVACSKAPPGPDIAPRTDVRELAASLETIIKRELQTKEIPALSIALVDDQETVWARGFGLADPDTGARATADTVYRVGSVSKLFTDMAVMQLVERGELDLDADILEYLPDLALENPFEKPVTLRQLMSHRSGLVREPSLGNYFDPSEPTLAATIASLNGARLVYPPETRTKYSNAGVAVVGYVLEKTEGAPFARYVREHVLDAFGMSRSDFAPSERVRDGMAKGLMWTYDGRTFSAPTFQLGMAPAGSLYSTVLDLGTFMSALFRGGGGVVTPETLEAMYAPQFTSRDPEASYGLGFRASTLDGRRRLGHGGAIYGFSTELSFLPGEKLGVVAVASKDFLNAVVGRIANHALSGMLAVKTGSPLPLYETTEPLPAGKAREIAREHRAVVRGDRLFIDRGSRQVEVRARGDRLVVDSAFGYGAEIDVTTLSPIPQEIPPDVPERWKGLIGEYGWDHDTLYILEKDEKLHALIEWFEMSPLEEITDDRFAFPDHGLYQGEALVFDRDENGRATAVVAAGVRFARRDVAGPEGETFRIEPLHAVEELREIALKATPPKEEGDFLPPDLVEPKALDDTIRLDIRYASTNNFMGSAFYRQEKAFLQRPAAEALVRAHHSLRTQGYGILIHDAYRPWYVTKMFYDATPEAQRIFVADPRSGSRHNRGSAADVTLTNLDTGRVMTFVSGYDEFSPRAFPAYPGGTSRERWLRGLLRREMEAEGFDVYEFEWWHFDYKDWQRYPILNETFEELSK